MRTSDESLQPILIALGLVLLVLWPRLADLGSVIVNDEPIWRGRAHRYVVGLSTLDPAMTFSGGQPGVTTMLFAGIAAQLHSWKASQAAIVIPVSILLLMAIVLLGRLAGWPLAVLTGVLLALDPFHIAQSRLVHTDALQAGFMLVALLLLALAWQMHSRRYLYISAAAAALAVLSKFFALWLPILVLAASFSKRFGDGHQGKRMGVIILLMLAVSAVIWPTVFAPAEPLSIITKYSKLSLAETEVGKGGGEPFYYLREWWFRVTPVAVVFGAVGLAGMLLTWRPHRESKQVPLPVWNQSLPQFPARNLILFLVVCTVAYGVMLTFSGQKSDRYFLLGFMVTDIVAAGGILWLSSLVTQLARSWKVEKVAFVAGLVLAGILAWDISYIHPYYLTYFNPLYPVTSQQKLGWGEGLERAAAWVQGGVLEGEEPPPVAVAYAFVLREFYGGIAESIGHEYDRDDYKYVILYRTMFGRGPSHESIRYLQAYFGRGKCNWQLTVNGLPHVWIFERLPQNERPTEERDAVRDGDLIELPQCAEEEIVSDPKARWVL